MSVGRTGLLVGAAAMRRLSFALVVLVSCSKGGGSEPLDSGTGASGGKSGTGTGGSSTGGSGTGGGAVGSGGAAAGSGGAVGSGGQGTGGLQGGTGGNSSDGGAGGGSAGRGGGAGGSSSGGRGGSAGAGSGGANRPDASADGGPLPMRVLLYSFSTLDIPSVPAQLAAFKKKLEGWQYGVDESKDPAMFTDTNLAKYAAVGMINTCFYPFGANAAGTAESQALQRFLQRGGGLFGTHCADVTFQSVNPAPLYNQLLGGRANSDNYTGAQMCRTMGTHPTIMTLPATFTYNGNLDNAVVAADTTVLVRCKFGGGTAADTPVSWVRNEGMGRVFFTSFGKVDSDLSNATIGDAHIMAGLGWVLGL